MGRPFGIPVYVSPSWFLIAALLTWWYAPIVRHEVPGIGNARYLVAFAFAVLLYVSVLVHELSHSVVARSYDLPVRRITLYLLGGVSEIEEEPQTPGREFCVAVAGPALSLVLALIGLLARHFVPMNGVTAVLVDEVTLANAVVGVFNLLPGLPLDGGRMLRAVVWKLTDRPGTGTVAAGWAGRVLAVAVAAIPFVVATATGGQPDWRSVIWTAFLAGFIWLGASQSIRVDRIRARLPFLRARALARRAVPVTTDLPLAEAIRRAGQSQAGAMVVVNGQGDPLALVNESAVAATPERRRPWVTVDSVARALVPGLTISADLAGRELLEAMRRVPASEYLLTEGDGKIYGVLVASDVDRVFVGV